jgi:hypothetical protein
LRRRLTSRSDVKALQRRAGATTRRGVALEPSMKDRTAVHASGARVDLNCIVRGAHG